MKTDPTDRPEDHRRADYSTFGREDQFIVPLLGSMIGDALDRHAAAPAPAGARALDVGCGAQPMRAELERRGFAYVGLDVVQNATNSVDFLAPIDEPLPDALAAAGPFELILCTEVLEHVCHWDRAFANFARLLAPGGRVIITAPFAWQLHEEPYDFWRPTLHAIAAHAGRAGLDVVERRQGGTIREVLGSLLGQMKIVSDRRGIRTWFRRRAIGVTRVTLLRVLKGPWFRDDVRIEGGYYLTSFAVLAKPASVAPSPTPRPGSSP